MTVTSGAMMAIFTAPASEGQHLEGEVARRVDPQHLERNPPPAAQANLSGRVGEEDPGQLNRLFVAGELHRHPPGRADGPVGSGRPPRPGWWASYGRRR